MGNEQSQGQSIFEKRTSTRRQFLKVSGVSIAGTALSMSLLGCLTNGDPAVQAWPTASGAIIHDPRLCTGCRRCETACTVTNDGKAHPKISRINLRRNFNFGPHGPATDYNAGPGQLGNFRIIGGECKQCADPYCGNICPVKAISADPNTGARLVDESTCIMCGACEQACPFDAIIRDPEDGKAKKCTLCYGQPACVDRCPNDAIRFVSWDDAVRIYHERGHGLAVRSPQA